MSIIPYNSQKLVGRYSCDILYKKVFLSLKAKRLIIKILTTKLKTVSQKYCEKIQIAISFKKKTKNCRVKEYPKEYQCIQRKILTSKLKLGYGHDPTLHKQKIKLKENGDFPRSPLVKTSPPNARGVGWIPGWEAEIPHALWPKHQKIKQAIL